MSRGLTVSELMSRVRSSVVGAFEHSDVPFVHIKDRLGVAQDASRSPVFQAMFVLQEASTDDADTRTAAVAVESGDGTKAGDATQLQPLDAALDGAAKFDLTLALSPSLRSTTAKATLTDVDSRAAAVPAATMLEGVLNFNTDLFDTATARRLAAQYTELLRSLARSTHSTRLAQLSMMSSEEETSFCGSGVDSMSSFPTHILSMSSSSRMAHAIGTGLLLCGSKVPA